MGARAFRAAGLAETLRDLGCEVVERAPVAVGAVEPEAPSQSPPFGDLGEIAAWTAAIEQAAYEAAAEGVPIFLGGDHSLSAGSIAGVSRRARERGEELFVLWLDAHPDFHTLDSFDQRQSPRRADGLRHRPRAASRAGTRRSSRR